METRTNTIIVPTDFSEVIDFAIDHAAGVCKMQDSKLMLLHVINKDTKTYLKKEKLEFSSINERLDKQVIELKEKYNIQVDYLTKEGSIFSAISEVTKSIGANMVFLGTHGKVGMQHLTGSYALKVVEKSPVPVIVVQKRGFRNGYKNIVLPVDDTTESKQKVKWAISVAKKLNSTVNLFALNVTDSFRKAKINGNIKQIIKFFDQNGIPHTTKISEKNGSFHKLILQYSQSIDADLMLIMTNPDKFLPSFISSQWEEQILFNELMIPVMAINPVDLNIIVGGL